MMNRLLSGVFSVAMAAAATADPKPTSCGQPLAPASGSYPFTEKALLDYAVPAGTTIGDIRITSLPVFDEANPDENNAIWGDFHLAFNNLFCSSFCHYVNLIN